MCAYENKNMKVFLCSVSAGGLPHHLWDIIMYACQLRWWSNGNCSVVTGWLTSGFIFSGGYGGSPAHCAASGLSGHLEHSDEGKSTDPGGRGAEQHVRHGCYWHRAPPPNGTCKRQISWTRTGRFSDKYSIASFPADMKANVRKNMDPKISSDKDWHEPNHTSWQDHGDQP